MDKIVHLLTGNVSWVKIVLNLIVNCLCVCCGGLCGCLCMVLYQSTVCYTPAFMPRINIYSKRVYICYIAQKLWFCVCFVVVVCVCVSISTYIHPYKTQQNAKFRRHRVNHHSSTSLQRSRSNCSGKPLEPVVPSVCCDVMSRGHQELEPGYGNNPLGLGNPQPSSVKVFVYVCVSLHRQKQHQEKVQRL